MKHKVRGGKLIVLHGTFSTQITLGHPTEGNVPSCKYLVSASWCVITPSLVYVTFSHFKMRRVWRTFSAVFAVKILPR